MRSLRLMLCGGLMLSCLTSCSVTLGPRAETRIVIVRPGRAMQVTQDVEVSGIFAGADQEVKQRIGGWIVMPREHYEALMRAVQAAAPKEPEKSDEGKGL